MGSVISRLCDSSTPMFVLSDVCQSLPCLVPCCEVKHSLIWEKQVKNTKSKPQTRKMKKKRRSKSQKNWLLERPYYESNLPSALGGVEKSHQATNKHGIRRSEVIAWLQLQRGYTLHKPARRRRIISQSYMWTRRCIRPRNHCLSFLASAIDTSSSSRKEAGKNQEGECNGEVRLLCSGTKTEVKKETQLFLCACFKGHGKHCHDLITAANREQIESISEIALNLLKGNIIIPKSSFEHFINDCVGATSFTREELSLTYRDWKRSSGWLESWEGLLFVTDVSTTCAEALFRVKWYC